MARKTARGNPKTKTKKREREGMRVRIHPLFLIVGGLYCILGELPAFLLSTTVALQHECAHAIAAAKLGYRLDRIVLMPYGAVIDGDLSGLGFKDEARVAIAGPLCNLLTAAGFVALWWLFPVCYPYTDAAAYVSLSVALVNLIPAYPLDGGRVLRSALCLSWGERTASRVCKVTAVVISALFLALNGLFWAQGNFSLGYLLFTLFLLTGCFGNGKDEKSAYIKIDYSAKSAFLRGVEVKRMAVANTCLLRRAVNFTERGKYLILDLYNEREEYLGSLTQNELAELFYMHRPNERLCDCINPIDSIHTSKMPNQHPFLGEKAEKREKTHAFARAIGNKDLQKT